jgi:hypothetical protein
MTLSIFGMSKLNAQNLSKVEALNVLLKWEGSWKYNGVIEASAWVTNKIEFQGKSVNNLVLNDTYLEMVDYNNNGINKGKNIIQYSQDSRRFFRWEFKEDGTTSFWIGEWSKSKNTMTWEFIDTSNTGITGQIIEKFKSEEKFKSNALLKDSKGNILLDIESLNQRRRKN